MRKFTPWEHMLLTKEYVLKYRAISRFPHKSPDEIATFQLMKITKIVELAYYGTRFYRNLYGEYGVHPKDIRTWADFKQLPTVTKSDIVNNQLDCIVDARKADKNLRVSRSSGSSGQMLEIVADTDRWVQSALIALRMYRKSLDFGPFSCGALIYTSRYPYQSAWGLYRVKYLHTLTPPGELIEDLLHLRPSFIISYPSILLELIAGFPRACSDLRVSSIATNSEHSTQQQRDELSKAFGAPVYDEYSTEELIFGGFQCRHGKYHLQEDGAYLEILDVEGPTELEATNGKVDYWT
jgi:phenylacetate-CoA ligase